MIFYDYIKGMPNSSVGGGISLIKFKTGYLSYSFEGSNEERILTSGLSGVSYPTPVDIYYPYNFHKEIVVQNEVKVQANDNYIKFAQFSGENNNLARIQSNTNIYFGLGDLTYLNTSGSFYINDLRPTRIKSSGTIESDTNIKAGTYVEAPYFNATSDLRAKENLTALPSMLDFINSTSVYTFKYKNSQLPSVGIIAQDVVNKPINDFNLVDNLEADGETEFMSVKESKLVYILWKAVQELSAEIEELKAQLNK